MAGTKGAVHTESSDEQLPLPRGVEGGMGHYSGDTTPQPSAHFPNPILPTDCQAPLRAFRRPIMGEGPADWEGGIAEAGTREREWEGSGGGRGQRERQEAERSSTAGGEAKKRRKGRREEENDSPLTPPFGAPPSLYQFLQSPRAPSP